MSTSTDTSRVDFSGWDRQNLEAFANETLARVKELENDLRASIDAYRNLLLVGVKK